MEKPRNARSRQWSHGCSTCLRCLNPRISPMPWQSRFVTCTPPPPKAACARKLSFLLTAFARVVESNPVMPRIVAALVCLLLSCAILPAQEPAQSTPLRKPVIPTVTYISDWRAQDPPRYSIAVDSTGRATYHSEPAADPNGGTAAEQ